MFIAHNQGPRQESYYFSNEELKKAGKSFFLKGEFIIAKNIFEGILKKLPRDAETLYELSQTLRFIDEHEKANEYHYQAISVRLNEYITRCDNFEQTEPPDLRIHSSNNNMEITGDGSNAQYDNEIDYAITIRM